MGAQEEKRSGAGEPVAEFHMDYRSSGGDGGKVRAPQAVKPVAPAEPPEEGTPQYGDEPLLPAGNIAWEPAEDGTAQNIPLEPELPADTIEAGWFEDAVQPEADGADGMFEDPPPEIPRRKARRSVRRRYGVVLGGIVLVFALIGVGFLVTELGRAIYNHAHDDSALRAYDQFLAPVVMQDPDPFENVAGANPDMVMTASLWRTISLNGDSYTTYDDQGFTLIPLGAVEEACKELFGPDCVLQPRSPEDTFYTFSAVDNQFHVQPYGTQSSYTPYTESMRKSGGSVFLKVGYVSAADEYRTQENGPVEKPKPVKYLEYELHTAEDGGQYIAAIRTLAE
jgi:hypothetical protein